MAWDEAKFERFVDATIRMARGELSYGRPHVVFPYPPGEELACIAELRQMPGRLHRVGFGSVAVPVARYVAEATKRYATRDLRDASEYERLQSDLSEPKTGLVTRTAQACVRDLRPQLVPGMVLVLGRLGALYPFGHVSSFLEALHREGLTHTLAVAYPGTAEGTVLRFLGLLDPTGGYRGHVVT